MIVVDSSALVAILRREPAADLLLARAAHAAGRLISAGTAVEAGIVVMARLGSAGIAELDALIAEFGIALVTVDPGRHHHCCTISNSSIPATKREFPSLPVDETNNP